MDSKFPYEFKKFLGKGAYGEVYLVELKGDPSKKFALKKIAKDKIDSNESSQKNLYNEIQIMQNIKKIKNQNVVHLETVLQSKEQYYIVMEYCNDGDLELHLKNHPDLSEEDIIELLQQLMNGFKAMHEISVVHRDIKPQNVFINDGVFKLGDFGFSRQGSGGIVQASSIYGTPAFMGPELLKQEIKIYTSKVDIWSLGVLMFFVAFKKYPFDLSGKKQLIPIFMFKVEGTYPNFDFGPALKQLYTFLNEQIKLGKISKEFANLFEQMLQPLPENRISFIELYNHSIFKKHNEADSEISNNFGEDLGLVSKGLDALKSNNIKKTSEFWKQKEEAQKLYIGLEQKEKQQLAQLQQGIGAQGTSQQSFTGISGSFLEISDQIPQGLQIHSQEKIQQLIQLQQCYIQTKSTIMFLRFITSELLNVSLKIKEVYSNSTIFSVLSYLYLKMRKMNELIEKKVNIYQSPIFDDFLQSVYYDMVQKQYKEDLQQISDIRNIISKKVQGNLNQTVFNQINNAKEPSEFQEGFIGKMIQFSLQIKEKYEKNSFQLNQQQPDYKQLKMNALKLAFYVACASVIDQPEIWAIISQEAKGQPEVIKYQGEQKDDKTLIQEINKIVEYAKKLLNKK